MQPYQEAIKNLTAKFNEEQWKLLINQIKKNHQAITQAESSTSLPQYSLTTFLREMCANPHPKWFQNLYQFLKIAYEKSRKLVKIFYKSLPMLATRYIQIHHTKAQGLDKVVMLIYNQERASYNESQKEKSELSKDVAIRKLYEDQLNKQMMDFKVEMLQGVEQVTNSNRNNLKNLLFYLIYRQAPNTNQQFLIDFYRAIFIYCGANEKQTIKATSLYLMQKNTVFSIFRYSISEEQIQWIILTLYELCTQVKKDKFELLAVISVLHKKVSNQSLFKMSEVVQSLIHLLEDQYSQVFI